MRLRHFLFCSLVLLTAFIPALQGIQLPSKAVSSNLKKNVICVSGGLLVETTHVLDGR